MSARYEISEGELDVLAITGPEGTRYIDGEEIEARVIRQQSADIAELRAELAAAVAERDRLRDAMADKIAHESYITGLTAGPGGLVMGMEGDGPRLLSAAFVAMYRDCGAVNYLEMTIQDPANGERFAVTVQRVEGKTPNQLRRDAEAERDHLRARLAAIDQTTGELCSVCGWRTILAWGCEKCERDKLSKRIDAIECQPAIARIESLPGPKGGAYLYIMGVDAPPNVSSGTELIARPAKEST